MCYKLVYELIVAIKNLSRYSRSVVRNAVQEIIPSAMTMPKEQSMTLMLRMKVSVYQIQGIYSLPSIFCFLIYFLQHNNSKIIMNVFVVELLLKTNCPKC